LNQSGAGVTPCPAAICNVCLGFSMMVSSLYDHSSGYQLPEH
jgi:hypothetical protein